METPPETTLVLADDHGIVRDGIAAFFMARPGYRILAQCADGEEALAAILSLKPDFALLDLNMPRLSGLDVVRRAKASHSRTYLMILSVNREASVIRELLRSGASGYILKDGPSRHIFDAMNYVRDGGKYVTPLFPADLIENKTESGDPMALLSRREYEVFGYLVDGIRPKDIAIRMGLSPKTVDTHRANIMRKLQVEGIAGLVRLAIARSHGQHSTPPV